MPEDLPARQRAVGRHGDAVVVAEPDEVALVEERVQLDLVVGDGHAADAQRARQPLALEVAYARVADPPQLDEPRQRVEGLLHRHVGVRPVDQVEVDVIDPHLQQSRLARGDDVAVAQVLGRHLGCDEERLAVAIADRLPHGLLVLVHLRRVDVPVAHLQRGPDGPQALGALEAPGSEPERRHHVARWQLNSLLHHVNDRLCDRPPSFAASRLDCHSPPGRGPPAPILSRRRWRGRRILRWCRDIRPVASPQRGFDGHLAARYNHCGLHRPRGV